MPPRSVSANRPSPSTTAGTVRAVIVATRRRPSSVPAEARTDQQRPETVEVGQHVGAPVACASERVHGFDGARVEHRVGDARRRQHHHSRSGAQRRPAASAAAPGMPGLPATTAQRPPLVGSRLAARQPARTSSASTTPIIAAARRVRCRRPAARRRHPGRRREMARLGGRERHGAIGPHSHAGATPVSASSPLGTSTASTGARPTSGGRHVPRKPVPKAASMTRSHAGSTAGSVKGVVLLERLARVGAAARRRPARRHRCCQVRRAPQPSPVAPPSISIAARATAAPARSINTSTDGWQRHRSPASVARDDRDHDGLDGSSLLGDDVGDRHEVGVASG